MHDADSGSDATVEWMTSDVAQRCREVLTILQSGEASAVRLGDAAILLRGASDDLASLVELLEGPNPVFHDADGSPNFGLVFGSPETNGQSQVGQGQADRGQAG